jgi:uncharacterized damage-inducible protein DinB
MKPKGRQAVDVTPLRIQLQMTGYVTKKNMEGITHAESLIQPRESGNCLNWVLGHMVAHRNQMLQLMGGEPLENAQDLARYGRGSSPIMDSRDALRFEDLLRDFLSLQDLLLVALDGMTREQLAAPAPMKMTDTDPETIGSLLSGLVFHEAYHSGQGGLLRRILGKEPIIR